MDAIKNIIINTPEESLEKILSPFIKEQFPSFMQTDYSKLVLFVKAYYEWLEQTGNPSFVLSKMQTVHDIDENADEFFSYFKNTFMASFPDVLAVDTNGNKPNKKTLLKKIREFYGSKGTESAYRFLFKILYDSDVEFYYPKTDVLRVSDGQWIEPRSIKTTTNSGSALFSAVGGQILQYTGTEITASATIDGVIQYSFGGIPVYEFFMKDIVGDYEPNASVKIVKDANEWQETTYSVLGEFFIELPGSGYRVGDLVAVTDSSGGFGFSAKIDQVGIGGSIKKIGVTNSGVNYGTDVVLNVFSENGKQSAKVIALRSAVTKYPGYFSGNRGKISSNKSIQDGHYFQDFSYELKTRVSLDEYFSVLKKLIHPAGLRMFGSILVKDAIDNEITSSTQGTFSKVPLIGQYTPYTPRTYNNLRNGIFLPNQVRGATLQVWLSAYTIEGNSATGVTANTSPLGNTASVAFGVNRFVDLARGVTYSVPNGNAAETTVWSVPRFKQEAINTHASLVIRPINERGSDFDGTDSSSWRSYGYWSGLTVGALGLSAARSYFVVAKGRTATDIGALNNSSNSRFFICDVGGQHGMIFGKTGGSPSPKVISYNFNSGSSTSVTGNVPTLDEWFLVCNTYTGTPNGSLSLFVNGVCAGTQTNSTLTTNIFTGNGGLGYTLAVGMGSGINSVFDGEIAEVICYQGNIAQADREKVEGYLAHKYGLAGKLPSTHPFKNTVPGGSYSSGRWYGNTGDYYPLGYNPYIGSTAQVGRDGTTAPLGSLFINSGLGYTFTVANEHGITSHNPTGSPLGSTAAWWDNGASGSNKETVLDPSHIRGLALWLKPENIGVCGSVANGRSADVWRDASPFQNHALPPTWGRFNGSGYASAGVTIDKLRPVLSVGSLAGPTGVCFNGGVLYAPTTVWNGASLAQWIQLGNTHGAGTTAERILTGQHLYLTNPLNLPDEADIFVVMRPTVDGYDKGLGLFSSDAGLTSHRRDDTVLYHRSYNPVDRNTSFANSTYYRVLPNGSLLYPSVAPSGLVGFRPSGSKTGVQQNTIAYDPHVSGVCFGVAVGEWRRDSSRKIESFLNGDASKNYSLSSGRRIAAVNTPSSDDYTITSGLVMHVDAANNASYSGSGTVVNDLSGNIPNGSITFYNTPLITENAFDFSPLRTDGLLVTGYNFTNLYDFTMECLFKVSGTHNTQNPQSYSGALMSSGDWNVKHWAIGIATPNTAVQIRLYDGSINLSDTWNYSFTVGRWYHLIVRRVANQIMLFINGVKQTKTITSNSSLPLNSNATFTAIGRETYAGGYFNLNGKVAVARIYNRGVSDPEIQQNFNVLRGRYGL